MWQNFPFLVEHEFLLGCRLGDDDCCNDNHDGNFDDNDEKMTKKHTNVKNFGQKMWQNFPFLVEHDGSSCLAAALVIIMMVILMIMMEKIKKKHMYVVYMYIQI